MCRIVLYVIIIAIIPINCCKKANPAAEDVSVSLPEADQIGAEHNRLLQNVLDAFPFNDPEWIEAYHQNKFETFLPIVEFLYTSIGLNRLVPPSAEYLADITAVWTDTARIVQWSSSIDNAQLEYLIERVIRAPQDFDTLQDSVNRMVFLPNSIEQLSWYAFQNTFLASLKFWSRFFPSVADKSFLQRIDIPWRKLALWDGIGALKGAIEFGRIGLTLGGVWGAFAVGATGAIFEGAVASSAAYLEHQVEKILGL